MIHATLEVRDATDAERETISTVTPLASDACVLLFNRDSDCIMGWADDYGTFKSFCSSLGDETGEKFIEAIMDCLAKGKP